MKKGKRKGGGVGMGGNKNGLSPLSLSLSAPTFDAK